MRRGRSDFHAVLYNQVSITPLQIDLTALPAVEVPGSLRLDGVMVTSGMGIDFQCGRAWCMVERLRA